MRRGWVVFWAVAVCSCSGGEPPVAVEAPKPPEVVLPSPPPVPTTPPVPPAPAEVARVALGERRFEEVCTYLVSEGFSPEVCAWLIGRATSADGPGLSSAVYERWLRGQRVRRLSGTVVGWYNERANEYEVRVGGRPAILAATETAFGTTGRFTMWAQAAGTTPEVLASGREVEVPVYREWPVHEAIREILGSHGDDAADAALALLDHLVAAWHESYCHVADPLGVGPCWVEGADGPVVSDERRAECRRACQPYATCRSMGMSHGDCDGNIDSRCRACRDEGAAP